MENKLCNIKGAAITIIKGIFLLIWTALLIFAIGCRERVIYKDPHYEIRLKNLVSYYKASPDLIIETDSGKIKINLNQSGKTLIPQEKITNVMLTQITQDSLAIEFEASDTSLQYQHELIGLNIKKAIERARIK